MVWNRLRKRRNWITEITTPVILREPKDLCGTLGAA